MTYRGLAQLRNGLLKERSKSTEICLFERNFHSNNLCHHLLDELMVASLEFFCDLLRQRNL